MSHERLFFFSELNTAGIKNKIIILDIDGTLVADSERVISLKTLAKIDELKQNNQVYLSTNSRSIERNKRIESQTRLQIIGKKHKKPNRKILEEIGYVNHENIVVIGDKFLTDGLFGKNIGARFTKVKRITKANDRAVIKIINWVDDLIYFILCKAQRRKY